MPSAFAHAAPALALIPAFRPLPRRMWVLGALGAAAPDLDVAAFALGIPYEHPLGHRGLSHSIPFAALVAAIGAWLALPRAARRASFPRAFAYLFLCTASHGILDAFTNGGLGVALLAPFHDTRWFAPVQPIEVSPLSVRAFFTERGWAVVASELRWVWVPAAGVATALFAARRRASS